MLKNLLEGGGEELVSSIRVTLMATTWQIESLESGMREMGVDGNDHQVPIR